MSYRADTDEEMIPFRRPMPGPVDYQNKKDQSRLREQHFKIRDLMLDGAWRTVQEISEILGYPETSISAQLRHLRKPQFGGWSVPRKKRKGTNVSEYQVLRPVKKIYIQLEFTGIPQPTSYEFLP